MHEGLGVNFVEWIPLKVELHQLGTLLEEAAPRDAGNSVLAQEPEEKWKITIISNGM